MAELAKQVGAAAFGTIILMRAEECNISYLTDGKRLGTDHLAGTIMGCVDMHKQLEASRIIGKREVPPLQAIKTEDTKSAASLAAP